MCIISSSPMRTSWAIGHLKMEEEHFSEKLEREISLHT